MLRTGQGKSLAANAAKEHRGISDAQIRASLIGCLAACLPSLHVLRVFYHPFLVRSPRTPREYFSLSLRESTDTGDAISGEL